MLSRYREAVRAWTDPIGLVLFRLRLRPNHLTVAGLGVSLLAAAAFVAGRTQVAGALLLLAGLFDFFDGSLARASGQVTAFGAFLDSVIDRYSDLVVLLGIVVFFAQMPHARAAIVAMAGLVGSVMVSYTKARAESIGVECTVGMMERPERLICLIAGALFGLLEPALWVLAILANITAIQRIIFTRRAVRAARLSIGGVVLGVLLAGAAVAADPQPRPAAEPEWTRAIAALQAGQPEPLVHAFSSEAALSGPIADYARFLLAEAQERTGNLGAARATALGVADHHPKSRLAPTALLLGATLAGQAGDDAGAQAVLKRLIAAYPEAAEIPEALYLLGRALEALGEPAAAVLVYQKLRVLAPASGWADGAEERLEMLAAGGVPVPDLSIGERIDRAERLLRGNVPKTAFDEAERLTRETQETGLAVRALRVMADAAQRLNRYETAARTLETLEARLAVERRTGVRLEQGRLWRRANQRERALSAFAATEASGTEAQVAEAIYLKGEMLEDMDRLGPAATAYRTVVTLYPAREMAGAALWRLGWLEYLRGDARAAAQTWLRVIEIPGGRPWRQRALYWAGRATEQAGSGEAADGLYRRALNEAPRSYYGLLAARRVPVLSEAATEPVLRLPADPREALGDDPGFARVDLLRRIGLAEFAVQEMEEVVLRFVGDPLRLYGLWGVYVEEERYHLALKNLRRHFTAPAATGHAKLPRAFWEMFYPFAWRYEITEAATRAGLDPYLVAAVILQESLYDPRALSRAGARGLMQLMPGTAKPLAELRGWAFENGDLLEDPRINIQIGTAFLGGLLREWNDPRLALAAYNAGPRSAQRWWQARRTNDMEAFVERIPFDETRRYVQLVMFFWDEYRRIYGAP